MNKLNEFIAMICGTFDNKQQYLQEEKSGNIIHPRAQRFISLCNDRISNLEEAFTGFFVFEQNYYETADRKTSFQHLFLFDVNEESKIRLTSYELPAAGDNRSIQNMQVDFRELKVSEKFTPLVYEETEGEFWGESISFFSSVTKFTLSMHITKDKLYVNEIFANNGKRMIGYDEPIVYDKISNLVKK